MFFGPVKKGGSRVHLLFALTVVKRTCFAPEDLQDLAERPKESSARAAARSMVLPMSPNLLPYRRPAEGASFQVLDG